MSTSSIFNSMNLIVHENVSVTGIYDYCSTNESYFLQTLGFISECRKEYYDANKKFYKSILESENNYIAVHESFSGFFEAIKNIIKKIIDFIKSLVNKFITQLHAFVKNEKYLTKHKDDFKKFTDKHEFKTDGYEFTFPAGMPLISPMQTFAQSMQELNLTTYGSGVDASKKNATIASELKKKYEALMRNLDDRFYDEIRAQVLGKNGDIILQSQYANELFSFFRNGVSSKEELEINNTKVIESYSRFETYKKFQSEVKKDKDRVEKEYTAIKKQIDSAMKRSADGTTIDLTTDTGTSITGFAVDKDIMSVLDLFIKAKSNQIQEMSNIHALAFSAKLDAINDCFKQDKTILYKALSKIQGMPKE